MKDDYITLLTVLDNLIISHRKLLEVEQNKIKLIINQDWETLEGQIEKSREILKRIRAHEKQRLDLIERIGGKRELSLSEILQSLPETRRDDLRKKGEKLQSIVMELKSLNRQIEQLLESSLEVINFTLSLFSGAGSSGKTYCGDGEEKKTDEKHTSLVFDLKA